MTPSRDDSQAPAHPDRGHASAWGIGSILLGLLLPIAVPLSLIAAAAGFSAYAANRGQLDSGDIRDLFSLLIVGLSVAAILPLLGFLFALRGLGWAGTTGAPRALPLAGLVLCLVNLIVLGITLTAVLSIRGNVLGY